MPPRRDRRRAAPPQATAGRRRRRGIAPAAIGEKRRSSPAAIGRVAATSVPTRRAAKSARTTRDDAERPYRPRSRRCPSGRTLFGQEIRRQETLHAARARRREAALHAAGRPSGAATVPTVRRPSRDGDRPRGDRPERKFGGERKFSRGAPDRGPRKDFGGSWSAQGFWRPPAARRIPSRGRSARVAIARITSGTRISTSRALTSRVIDRGGDERPRFSRAREDRPQGDRPEVRVSTAHGKIVRNSIGPGAMTANANSTARASGRRPHRLAGASAQRPRRRSSAPRK